jgi:ethanolamine utilization protein EutQ (cupin superfamily)
MKTAMQELLEWVRATLPMDLETPRLIEQKIESMLEKEKEQMCEFAEQYFISLGYKSAEDYFDRAFNTKEK